MSMGITGEKNEKPRIGVINVWCNRGTSYQSQFLIDVLRRHYDIFLFLYKEKTMPPLAGLEERTVFFKKDNPKDIINWIRNNHLDMVFSPGRDERDSVLDWAKSNDFLLVPVLNYEELENRLLDHYRKYLKILCPVKCTYDALKKMGLDNLHLIRCAVDTSVYSAAEKSPPGPVRFLHNAGWGGAGWRKNTEAVLSAFEIASAGNKDMTLLFKTQRPLKEYPPEVLKMAKSNPKIIVNEKDVSLEEMLSIYRSCDVSLLPSKWEGIGLPFIESLSVGLPVITVDAPPMNEWIENGVTGHCCKVSSWEDRGPDSLIKGALVDVEDLAKQILRFSDRDLINSMRDNCINFAKELERNFRSGTVGFVESLLEKRS